MSESSRDLERQALVKNDQDTAGKITQFRLNHDFEKKISNKERASDGFRMASRKQINSVQEVRRSPGGPRSCASTTSHGGHTRPEMATNY
jgi:hypothetical protein